MKKIAIWGFGITGQAASRYFVKSPKYLEYQIDIYEAQPANLFEGVISHNERVNYYFGSAEISDVSRYEILLVSPSIPKENPVLQKAYESGVKVCNDTMIFIEEFKGMGKIIGVTGSNGKSTVVSLIYESLKTLGKKAILVGNIGQSPLDYLIDYSKQELDGTIAVIELSSFQLEIFEDQHYVDIAIITNLSPNHLDRHHNSMQEYADVKMKIFNQAESQIITVSDDQGVQEYILPKIKSSSLHLISLDSAGSDELISFVLKNYGNPSKVKLPGKHNLYNIAVSNKVLEILGIEINNQKLISFIQDYKGLEHRIEFVRNLNGLSFYNDSKSTSPDATRVAIESFDESQNIILIMGGKDKKVSFDQLGPLIKSKVDEIIILSHEIDQKIVELAEKNSVPYRIAENLKQVIDIVITSKIKNGVVLFSPGSSSLGKFKNYEDRGKQFKDIVNSLN